MLIPFDEEKVAFGQIIELIHQFSCGTAFLLWLGEDQLVDRIVFEKVGEGRFERVFEYYIGDLKVSSNGGHFYLNQIEESFKRNLASQTDSYSILASELSKMEKKIISDFLVGSSYTIFMQFCSSDKVCGSCWAIYDMKNLLQICRKKNVNLACPDLSALYKKVFPR